MIELGMDIRLKFDSSNICNFVPQLGSDYINT